MAIIVGGPDGLDPALKASAHETMRLSSLTLPHAMVRVMLAEAVYRAWSVLKNHPTTGNGRPAPAMSIYLASNSPRRRELLHQIHVRHEALLFRGPG